MENVLRDGVDEKFDLKGCYNRDDAGRAGLQVDGTWKQQVRRLNLRKADADALVKQLALDAEFLESQNVMDYSLLIGIKKDDEHSSLVDAASTQTGAHHRWLELRSASGKEIYSLAIIDILTP